jgi:hypothetical protein
MEQGVMGKLARIAMGVFGARHSHVGVRRCYGSKISKGGFIKVTSDLMRPMRKGDTIRCLGESKVRKDLQCGSKEFKAASGLYPRNLGSQRYNALIKEQQNEINASS